MKLNLKRLGYSLAVLGAALTAIAIGWWVRYFGRVSQALDEGLGSKLPCLYASPEACDTSSIILELGPSSPYIPLIFWLAIVTLVLGLAIRASLAWEKKGFLVALFLAPALILYGTFVLYPYAQAMYIAFTSWRGLRRAPRFVGLDNFERLLGDDDFWNALSHNGIYLVVLPILTLGFALFLAFMITQKVRFSNFYRITFFFPQVMSVVAIGILWSFVYHPTIGILNGFLGLVGVESPPTWLGDPNTALAAIAAVTIWQAAGFYMVIFMAGMQSIPTSFYEAAALDGATRADIFFRITLPLLWETTRSALVFIVIGAMNMFGITQTMTQGGPDGATDVLATLLYEEAFIHSRFGYSTAIAMAYFVIVLILSFLLMLVTRRDTIEY